LSLIEWAWTNALYTILLEVQKTELLLFYIYGDIVWIVLMWGLTAGRTLSSTWIRRDLEGDAKPERTHGKTRKSMEQTGLKDPGTPRGSIEMCSTHPISLVINPLEI